jgi:F-box and WD-40 domain protein 1/11
MDLDEKVDSILRRLKESQGDIRLWVKNGKLGMEKPPKAREEDSHEDVNRLSTVCEDERMEDMSASQSAQPSSIIDRRIHTPLLGPGNLLEWSNHPRTDWQYMYKQRRKLENNWNVGRYRNFRLPRHDHPEEAHTQCIYTMQFSPKHVVSGSRDQTIRIWSLETKRLVGKPLQGHRGSVLCLQFDESPDQDVIISGGSDADVIIWNFSTGQIAKRLKRAHEESVLNLRFDHRYLITCSKDKTIKLWNRMSLLPTHDDYPRVNSKSKDATFPDYIVNIDDVVNTASLHSIQPLDPYTLLMTFIGHNAAVNAIQVHGDEIVSASGDRKIFLWNIKTGQLIRHYAGHTKGIACVQYDGKRIVSGSSDKNVCIFDSVTGGELATLHGHRDLVRTVQADFADAPYSDDLYATQAAEHDMKMRELKSENRLRYEMPFSSGTKLPPGGGGNPWSKIVSGSYDETVMIWKKSRDGSWNVIKELRQDDAMRATSGISPSAQDWGPRVTMAAMAQQAQDGLRDLRQRQAQLAQMHDQARAFYQSRPIEPSAEQEPPTTTDAQMTDLNTASVPAPSQPHVPAHLNPQHPLSNYTAPPRQDSGSDMAYGGNRIAQPPHPLSYTPPAVPQSSPSPSIPTPAAAPRSNGLPLATQRRTSAIQAQAAASSPSRMSTTIRPSTQDPRAAPTDASTDVERQRDRHRRRLERQAAAQQQADEADGNGASRVFKLQFNSRFIMCCSQQPVIVGWDFANGDREIEEASAFFGMPESTP